MQVLRTAVQDEAPPMSSRAAERGFLFAYRSIGKGAMGIVEGSNYRAQSVTVLMRTCIAFFALCNPMPIDLSFQPFVLFFLPFVLSDMLFATP